MRSLALVLLLVFSTSCGRATGPPTPTAESANLSDTERAAALTAAKALIARTPFATLTTIGDAGAPHSRIVEPFPIEDEFTLWVATTGASRKVRDIERDGRVTLLFFDQQAPGYVSLEGTAAVVRAPAEKAKRWKDSWVAFYKDRNRGDDYTLLRITPRVLEISSPNEKMLNDPLTWKPVTVAVGK